MLGLNFGLEGFDEDQLVIWDYDTFSPWSHDVNGDIVDGLGDVEALEDGEIEVYGIGPAVPGHPQKYPEEALAAVWEDDRV